MTELPEENWREIADKRGAAVLDVGIVVRNAKGVDRKVEVDNRKADAVDIRRVEREEQERRRRCKRGVEGLIFEIVVQKRSTPDESR